MKWLILVALGLASGTAWGQIYQRAVLEPDGSRLELIAAAAPQIHAPKLKDQVGFDKPQVSTNGRLAGWLALYSNCCTSYPIPLELVIFRAGRIERVFHGNGEAIFAWRFLRDGAEVAYRQGPLHFSDAEYFELRRVGDGKLLATYDYPGEGEGRARAEAIRKAPDWVKQIASD